MRSAAYLGLGLLLTLMAPALAAPPGAPPPAAKLEDTAAQPGAAQAATAAAQPRTARERRRAHSYASCNRGAYLRGLRGGARRRFLIRCRLGYDRPRLQPQQAREPAGGAQPMRKP